ncbi:MAG TPA: hypothetical protein VE890_06450 [Thermoguttaceae bacterium]|nr:hypothetical protein [Thermoguttaceae bacterium]
MNTDEHYLDKVVILFSPSEAARGFNGQLPPQWLRTSFVDRDGSGEAIDRVYIPIDLLGNPMKQFLCACIDGVPMARDSGHYYVPASWIMRQRPDMARQIQRSVECILREYLRHVA